VGFNTLNKVILDVRLAEQIRVLCVLRGFAVLCVFVRFCCKQCGQVKFLGTMTKWPVQKHTQNITKHGVYKDATDIRK